MNKKTNTKPTLDYGKFSVRVPEKDADDLIDILKFQTNLEELQKNAHDARTACAE